MQIIRAHVPRAGGTVTGPILFPDGSAAAPSIAFANDPDTGFFISSPGNFCLVVNGTLQWIASSSGVLSLRGASKGFTDSNNNELLLLVEVASAVNEITITNAATGNPAIISATGGDANIDIAITPKGTGVLRVGTHSAIGVETVTGYITVKDSGGVSRKLAVVS